MKRKPKDLCPSEREADHVDPKGFERVGVVADRLELGPPEPPAAGKFLMLRMDLILEPALAMRESMGDEEMRELTESLSELGQLQPILVVRRNEHYEIIDGHRRWFAATLLHWTHLAAKVYESKGMALEAAKVHSNVVRESVNPAHEAVYYHELLDRYKLDEAGLCALVKRSPSYIADRLALLRGDPAVFDRLRDGSINFAVARELNRCTDGSYRASFLDQAIRSGTSGRVVAGWVAEQKTWTPPGAGAAPGIATPAPPPEVPAYHRSCALCGGDRDQFNLEEVTLHKWEWAMLKELMETAALKGLTLAQVGQGLKEVPE